MADVGVGEAEHVDGGEARVVGDLARRVDGDGLAAMLGPAEEAAELDPSVVFRPPVAEPPVGRERKKLEGERDHEARRGQRAVPLRRPPREHRGAQRNEHEEEALAEDVAAHVDPVGDPARREERLVGQPPRARRRHRGRGQHDDVRQQAGAEGEIPELTRGVRDAGGERARDLRVVGVGKRVAVVREPPAHQGRGGKRHREGARACARPVAAQGQERHGDSRADEAVRAREDQQHQHHDQRPDAPRAVVSGRLCPERDLQQQHQRRLHPRCVPQPERGPGREQDGGQRRRPPAVAVSQAAVEQRQRRRRAHAAQGHGEGMDRGVAGDQERGGEEQDEQEVRVALDPLAGVEGEAEPGGEVAGVAVRDVGVVAPDGVTGEILVRVAVKRVDERAHQQDEHARAQGPPFEHGGTDNTGRARGLKKLSRRRCRRRPLHSTEPAAAPTRPRHASPAGRPR